MEELWETWKCKGKGNREGKNNEKIERTYKGMDTRQDKWRGEEAREKKNGEREKR